MRVLFLTHNFPRTSTDLPGNFLLRFARALGARGVEVRVIAPHAPKLPLHDTVDGVPVTRFRYAPDRRETLAYSGTMAAQATSSARGALDLVQLIRRAGRELRRTEFHADVVHAHWWFPAGLAASTRALRGRPLVVTLHGSDVRLGRGLVARQLMRRVLRRSARVTAVSSWLATQASASTGVPDPLVEPMPADVDLFFPRPQSRDGLLFVGKLDAQKGAAVLLDALTHLPATVSATVVGDGPDAAALRVRAASLGVAHRVRWLGALSQQDLPDLYRRASLFVAPVTAPEGLGLTAVEALLCETPVVASASGGLTDIVSDGRTGRLVPAGQPEALARAIADSLAAPPQLAVWGRTGRSEMLTRFSPATVAARYHTLYSQVSAPRAG